MKYVQVLEDIPITIPNPCPLCRSSVGDNSARTDLWSFVRYLENIVLADPGIGSDYKSLKVCFVMDKAFLKAVPGEYVEVDWDHWEKLKETIENPKGGGISPSILRQFLPFMDAIIEAKDTKPKDEKPKSDSP